MTRNDGTEEEEAEDEEHGEKNPPAISRGLSDIFLINQLCAGAKIVFLISFHQTGRPPEDREEEQATRTLLLERLPVASLFLRIN